MYSFSSQTLSTLDLRTFIHMMVLRLEIQNKAKAEIDAVVGDQRLPNFDDRASLPHIDAVYRELMRLHGFIYNVITTTIIISVEHVGLL
ncbi:hypothetical protein C8R44DRAFT_608658 [Mycena epipterygia]|nr:hypothetical protein C8R44DRAFT_608658 [Mycena epipterygia]